MKKKHIKKVLKRNEEDGVDNMIWFVQRLYHNAERIQSVATLSHDINEFSELYDDMVSKLIEMDSEDIQILSQII